MLAIDDIIEIDWNKNFIVKEIEKNYVVVVWEDEKKKALTFDFINERCTNISHISII